MIGRPPVPVEAQRRFWQGVAGGLSTPQSPRLEDPNRSTRRTTLPTRQTRRCCNDRLNPPPSRASKRPTARRLWRSRGERRTRNNDDSAPEQLRRSLSWDRGKELAHKSSPTSPTTTYPSIPRPYRNVLRQPGQNHSTAPCRSQPCRPTLPGPWGPCSLRRQAEVVDVALELFADLLGDQPVFLGRVCV